jgi:predicted phosphodiesterase
MAYWLRGSTVSAITIALLVLPSILAPVAGNAQTRDSAFQFGILGDMPYTKAQEPEYRRVLEALNRADLAFVVHIGDFEQDARRYDPALHSMPCVDENFKTILDSFQSSKHPFILTPGDNDWTDCHFLQAPKVDPLEALAKIRSMFFPEGRSLGQRTIAVTSQASDPQHAKFRENLRWSMGGVTFATLHIVGSNDNLGRTPEMDAEHTERKAANIAWLKQTFAHAKADGSLGLVLLTQANLIFEKHWSGDRLRLFLTYAGVGPSSSPGPTGHDDYVKALADEMESYEKPTVILHGDSHIFRVDKPLISAKTGRSFENFTRVETFGAPDSHWIRVIVDPVDPQLFTFKPEIVPENVVNRRPK